MLQSVAVYHMSLQRTSVLKTFFSELFEVFFCQNADLGKVYSKEKVTLDKSIALAEVTILVKPSLLSFFQKGLKTFKL